MASEKVTIFTNKMRDEFLTSFEATAPPTPIDAFTLKVASTQRFEHYPWLAPVPGLARWKGHRRFGKIGEITYKVENLEHDSSFEVLLRDIEDDQVGGYSTKPQELAQFAKVYPNQLVLQHLAAGATNLCFDGTAFFADSHTIGTGDNLMSGTAAASDSVTHKIAVLVHNGPLKPLIYQDRKAPKFNTDADTAQSSMAKMVRYWIDLESACAYGHWWSAILLSYSNTPTLTELQTDLGLVESRFKEFKLQETFTGDQPQYLHTMLTHAPENTTIVTSPKLSNMLRTILSSSAIRHQRLPELGWPRGQPVLQLTVSRYLTDLGSARPKSGRCPSKSLSPLRSFMSANHYSLPACHQCGGHLALRQAVFCCQTCGIPHSDPEVQELAKELCKVGKPELTNPANDAGPAKGKPAKGKPAKASK